MTPNQRIYLCETRGGRLNAVLETVESVVVQNIDEVVTDVLAAYPRVYWLSRVDRVAVGYQGADTFYFASIPSLRIRSTYQIIPEDKITPTWGLSDNMHGGRTVAPQVDSDQVWKTPVFMSLWLIYQFGINSAWYLVASIPTDVDANEDDKPAIEFRKLPVGNQHTDARMCMGDEFSDVMSKTVRMSNPPSLPGHKIDSVLTFLSATKDYLGDSLWNSDLCSDEQRKKSEQLFQWNLSDMSQVGKTMEEVRTNSWTTSGPFDACLLALERGTQR